MNFYTVKQIAEMLKTNEETVRRWIRSGKLVATRNSKKSGNIISAAALEQFVEQTPKYASMMASSFTSTVAMSAIVGGILGGLLALMSDKEETVSKTDVETVIKKKIDLHEKKLNDKKAELLKLQKEIEEEENNLGKYRYALENLDLELIAMGVNDKGGKA